MSDRRTGGKSCLIGDRLGPARRPGWARSRLLHLEFHRSPNAQRNDHRACPSTSSGNEHPIVPTDKPIPDRQDLVAEHLVRLVLATRTPGEFNLPDLTSVIQIGCSPRATLGLVAASRALALIHGRDYVLPTTSNESRGHIRCDTPRKRPRM